MELPKRPRLRREPPRTARAVRIRRSKRTTASSFLWLVPTVERFPRSQKFLLGDRIQNTTLDLLDSLIEATCNRQRGPHLARANPGLEKLRFLMRLAHDLGHPDHRRYEHAARCRAKLAPPHVERTERQSLDRAELASGLPRVLEPPRLAFAVAQRCAARDVSYRLSAS